MISNSAVETYFCHAVLLTNRHVSKLPKDFVLYSPANLNL